MNLSASGRIITSNEELRALYDQPWQLATRKCLPALDRHCRQFIAHSPFLVLASHDGRGNSDASPRGGRPGFVDVLDDTHLLLPDQTGNNRLDTMTNVLSCPDVGLLFLIPGMGETLRASGTARVITDTPLLEKHESSRFTPRTGLVIELREVFLHCAKSISRSRLWDTTSWPGERKIAPASVIFREQTKQER